MNRPATGTNWGLRVIDKLGEARFFLRKLQSTTRFDESSYYASAFASACYSVTECLKARCARHLAQKAWWDKTLVRLKADLVFEYFSAGRGAEVHEGDSIVSGIAISVFTTAAGDVESVSEAMLRDDGPAGTSGSPAAEARKYFALLLSAAREGFNHFDTQWDPTHALQSELKRMEDEEL